MSKTTKQVLLGFLMILVLGISGCIYSITRGPWIEWDEHDPKLHGQEITFNVPMSYTIITTENTDDYQDEEIEIGRILRPKKASYRRGGALEQGYTVKDVNVIGFTIIGSYWLRRNWWEKSFGGDMRKMIIQDSDGLKSMLAFFYLDRSSNPGLKKLEYDGALK